jgi:hypothetical protein
LRLIGVFVKLLRQILGKKGIRKVLLNAQSGVTDRC